MCTCTYCYMCCSYVHVAKWYLLSLAIIIPIASMISWLCSYNIIKPIFYVQLNLRYKLLLYMKMQTPYRLWSMCSYTRCKHCNGHVQYEYGLCGLVINLHYFISYFTIPLNVLRSVVFISMLFASHPYVQQKQRWPGGDHWYNLIM